MYTAFVGVLLIILKICREYGQIFQIKYLIGSGEKTLIFKFMMYRVLILINQKVCLEIKTKMIYLLDY